MGFQSTISALAASMTFAAAAQTPPARVEWLPMFGPVADKVCENGSLKGLRPGHLFPMLAELKADYVWAIDNNCQRSIFRIDATTATPIEFLSKQRMTAGPNGAKPVADARALDADWWLQQPQLPSSMRRISSKADSGGYCAVTLDDSSTIKVPVGSVVVPDSSHAYYIKPSPDSPADHCKAELMIKMPAQTTTVSGGGMRNPGNISSPPATTPAGNYINVSGFANPIIGALFNLLGKYTDLMPAYSKDNCVILTYGMDKADTTRRAHNLTPEQAAMAAPAFANQTPEAKANRCREEWREATDICINLMGGPNRGITGGYKNTLDCMRGLISEECRGNDINWGEKGRPPTWRPL